MLGDLHKQSKIKFRKKGEKAKNIAKLLQQISSVQKCELNSANEYENTNCTKISPKM